MYHSVIKLISSYRFPSLSDQKERRLERGLLEFHFAFVGSVKFFVDKVLTWTDDNVFLTVNYLHYEDSVHKRIPLQISFLQKKRVNRAVACIILLHKFFISTARTTKNPENNHYLSLSLKREKKKYITANPERGVKKKVLVQRHRYGIFPFFDERLPKKR